MKIECTFCRRRRPDFAFAPDGRCDQCQLEKDRLNVGGRPVLTWHDIRGKRAKLLAACDWTQQADVDDAVSLAWQPYRQSLRDVTNDFDEPADVVWPSPPS